MPPGIGPADVGFSHLDAGMTQRSFLGPREGLQNYLRHHSMDKQRKQPLWQPYAIIQPLY